MAFYLRRLWLTKHSRFSKLLVVLVLVLVVLARKLVTVVQDNQIP